MLARLRSRLFGVSFAIALAIGVIALAPPPASGVTSQTWTVQASADVSGDVFLYDVTATSATNAWAVGTYRTTVPGVDRTLIEHWDGVGWTVQASPSKGKYSNDLWGVAATSATNAWAVGTYRRDRRTLIEHWDGVAWTIQPSPNPGGAGNVLHAVTATSATNAWAVGYQFSSGSSGRTLIEHWDGISWTVQPSPTGSSFSQLLGVAAVSRSNAWAVGARDTFPIVQRWNGTSWTSQTNPTPGYANALFGAAATSSSDVWAVGTHSGGVTSTTLVDHWDGSSWTRLASPNVGFSDNLLYDVSAVSSSSAVAGGEYGPFGKYKVLIESWDGTSWKVSRTPDPSENNVVRGVVETSPTNAWAVGYQYSSSTPSEALILHCC